MKPFRLITILAAFLLLPLFFTSSFASAEDLQEITIRVVEADQCIPQQAKLPALMVAGSSDARLIWLDDDRFYIAANHSRVWLGAKGMSKMNASQLLNALKVSRIRYWEINKQQYRRWNRGAGCI